MRVVVAAPQVPFVRGGAELMAEDLVAALRARGHESEIVSIPFKWYPGSRVLDQAFLWRLVDLTESDGRPIDRVIATKFPAYCVRHPNKVAWVLHQFRQAYDYDRTELGQFDESPAGPRDAPRDRAPRCGLARRGAQGVRDLAERRRSPPAVQRDHRGGAAAPAAVARVSRGGARGLRPLGQPARPREADRPARRSREAGPVASDRDRRRRPGPRAAGAPRDGAQRPGDVRRPRRRGAARRSLRALSRRLLRAGRRGLRNGSVRGVPLGEARRHRRRRRRSARGRARPRDRRGGRARCRRGRARPAPISRRTSTRRRPGAAPGRALAERVTWDACVDALLS